MWKDKRKPELLAPAGDMERLKMAVAYGADAVYLAGTTFGMRAFAGNFDEKSIYDAVRLCHSAGVRTHVTINTMPHGDQTITNNGYDGQFCLHMLDSKTHGSDSVNSEHQKAIRMAYNWAH